MGRKGKDRPECVQSEEGKMEKPRNFGVLYRMGNRGFYNYMRAGFQPTISYAEACNLRSRFFDGYPDLAAWQDAYAQHSRQQGFTAGSMDLVISSLAFHHGAEIITFDDDFLEIAKITGVRVKHLQRPI